MIKKFLYKLRYRNLIHVIAKGTDVGQHESFKVITDYKRIFKIIYGKNFVYEVLLNYRVHYKTDKQKIMYRYQKIISPKNKLYKSDIAISLNILNKFNLTKDETACIFDVLRRYFNKPLPNALLKHKAEQLINAGKLNR